MSLTHLRCVSFTFYRIRPWRNPRSVSCSRRRSICLDGSKQKDEEGKDIDPDTSSNNNKRPLLPAFESLKEQYNTLVEKVSDSIPPTVQETLQMILEKLKQFQLVVLGFAAGAILAVTAILVPVYAQMETLSQPVTLFETILGDLESAYVDEVDTNKLFETGISAMLRSLDPYTEFEGVQEAVNMAESIDGRYAGVGLIISGTNEKVMEKVKKSGAEDGANQGAVEQNIIDGSVSSSSTKDENDDESALRRENAKAYAKAKRRGIQVVSAFEGYAYDYGLRVGDKLVAIDGQPVTVDATVESVRNMLRGQPGTTVSISFERVGLDGVQTVDMPRTVVTTRYVLYSTFDFVFVW